MAKHKKGFWEEVAKGKETKKKSASKKKDRKQVKVSRNQPVEPVRLNKFIANAGVCSRRDADKLIEAGKIRVNGKVCNELGKKIHPQKDVVEYNKKRLFVKDKLIYLLMNKPKDHISTVSDDMNRKTVMNIVRKYTQERVYPVGRLDRNTTGLLLMTNDGELTKKMTHPSHQVSKLYSVRLDKPVLEDHLIELRKGIELEDGHIKADKIDYAETGMGETVGVEIHSGRNRIVRRMFEHLGYKVVALDRVAFGPLTKKKLPRGTCRELTAKEIAFLKML